MTQLTPSLAWRRNHSEDPMQDATTIHHPTEAAAAHARPCRRIGDDAEISFCNAALREPSESIAADDGRQRRNGAALFLRPTRNFGPRP